MKKAIVWTLPAMLVATLVLNSGCDLILSWFDKIKPTVTLAINNGNTYTATKDVNLTISAHDDASGVDAMRLSNFNDFRDSQWEGYKANKSWALLEGDGEKTVFIQVKDKAGNISDTAQATIILKADLPAYNIIINNGADYTNNLQVTLSLSAHNTGISANVARMYLANTAVFPGGNGYAYADSFSWIINGSEGENKVYVWFEDSTGDRGGPFSDSIILDTRPPTGSAGNVICNGYFTECVIGKFQHHGHFPGLMELQTDGTGSPIDRLILTGSTCNFADSWYESFTEEIPAANPFSWDYFHFSMYYNEIGPGKWQTTTTYRISVILVDKAGNHSTPIQYEKTEIKDL